MGRSLRIIPAGLALAVVLAVTACSSPGAGGSPSNSSGVNAATADSAAALGGMDALVAAAKKEGTLNVIALPPKLANYAAVIDGFTARYGITVNSTDRNGSSQDEIDAITKQKGTDRAPDVVDVGMSVALANTRLFAPYKVATWNDIPDDQKEATGLWFQDYGGYMSIGYDSSRLPAITSVADLLGPRFTKAIALTGDPTRANAALAGVMMASVANGGSLDDISKGVDFFGQLKKSGNFVPEQATSATVKHGTTPVVFDWDYLSAAYGDDVPTWKVFVPSRAVIGGFYAQAINKDAPHPAAARLWEEYLYSDEGQNLWLKGGVHPVRMAAMIAAGTIDATAAAALPRVTGTPMFMSRPQATAARDYLAAHWAKAVDSR